MEKVKIDIPDLNKWIESMANAGTTQAEIARNIGKTRAYFCSVRSAGEMPKAVHALLCRTYNLPDDSFVVKEEPVVRKKPTEEEHDGYWTETKIGNTSVKFTIWFSENGTDIEVAHGYASIRGNKELHLVQAISYAAHMCYKMVEQNGLQNN